MLEKIANEKVLYKTKQKNKWNWKDQCRIYNMNTSQNGRNTDDNFFTVLALDAIEIYEM